MVGTCRYDASDLWANVMVEPPLPRPLLHKSVEEREKAEVAQRITRVHALTKMRISVDGISMARLSEHT
jgi:hypothetical protein